MTYRSAPLQAALDKILAIAASRDEQDIARGWELAAALPELPDGLTTATYFAHTPLAVDRATADLLYLLARSGRAQRIVEIGCSFGVSTLALAAAAADNGGSLVTTEIIASKAAATHALLEQVGLSHLAEVRVGDALETLAAWTTPIDLLFLDGHKPDYLGVLLLLEPMLAAGALVIADDTELLRKQALPFLEHLERSAKYFSVDVPMGDGLTVALVTTGPSC